MDRATHPRGATWRRRRLGATAALVVGALLLAGCGLRVESPPPPLLVPDLAEVVRQHTAEDAAALVEMATRAAVGAAEPVATVLAQVAAASAEHLDALGGLYEPFPDPTPGATPMPTATAAVDAATTLVRLSESAVQARSDADRVPDGELARLVASVAANRLLLGDRLAGALGQQPSVPADVAAPPALPAGLAVQDVVVLVQSEDAAGMVWEVAAARSTDGLRDSAAARGVTHRDRAQAWAELTGIAGTGSDPRRTAYDLPDAVTAEAGTPEDMWTAVRGVEAGLVDSYASLIATAEPGGRAVLLDALIDAMRQVLVGGGGVPTFPGMPERR